MLLRILMLLGIGDLVTNIKISIASWGSCFPFSLGNRAHLLLKKKIYF